MAEARPICQEASYAAAFGYRRYRSRNKVDSCFSPYTFPLSKTNPSLVSVLPTILSYFNVSEILSLL